MSMLVSLVGRLPRGWIKAAARLQWRHPLLKRLTEWASSAFRGQDGVIAQGAGRGLRFNTANSTPGYLLGTSEPAVQFALQRLLRPGMCVCDVGANVGFFSMIAARLVGSSGRVIAFDPLPANARQVEHNAALNGLHQVVVHNRAVGRTDGTALFETSREPTWGKLASVGLPAEPSGSIAVEVVRLDSTFASGDCPPPDLIKIDVEGAEVDVLAGASELLRRARPLLLIELHGTNQAVADLLSAHNYLAYVLGSKARAVDSPWDAQLFALPAERTDLVAVIEGLTRPDVLA